MMMKMWEMTTEIGDNYQGDNSVDKTHPLTQLAAIELPVREKDVDDDGGKGD